MPSVATEHVGSADDFSATADELLSWPGIGPVDHPLISVALAPIRRVNVSPKFRASDFEIGVLRPRQGSAADAHHQLPSLPLWENESTHACVQRTATVCLGHPVANTVKISSNGNPNRMKGIHVVSMLYFGMIETADAPQQERAGVTFIPMSEAFTDNVNFFLDHRQLIRTAAGWLRQKYATEQIDSLFKTRRRALVQQIHNPLHSSGVRNRLDELVVSLNSPHFASGVLKPPSNLSGSPSRHVAARKSLHNVAGAVELDVVLDVPDPIYDHAHPSYRRRTSNKGEAETKNDRPTALAAQVAPKRARKMPRGVAATKIQAGFRGHQARKKHAAQQQMEADRRLQSRAAVQTSMTSMFAPPPPGGGVVYAAGNQQPATTGQPMPSVVVSEDAFEKPVYSTVNKAATTTHISHMGSNRPKLPTPDPHGAMSPAYAEIPSRSPGSMRRPGLLEEADEGIPVVVDPILAANRPALFDAGDANAMTHHGSAVSLQSQDDVGAALRGLQQGIADGTWPDSVSPGLGSPTAWEGGTLGPNTPTFWDGGSLNGSVGKKSGEVIVGRPSLGSLPDDEHPFHDDLNADFSNPLLG